ncbi:hypothetical protein BMS3Abin12_00960 [bacterium BMS3Abin12]|nr:hypothetical protein BMS3Abin12_00960 [bacterium BMS3Abin12]
MQVLQRSLDVRQGEAVLENARRKIDGEHHPLRRLPKGDQFLQGAGQDPDIDLMHETETLRGGQERIGRDERTARATQAHEHLETDRAVRRAPIEFGPQHPGTLREMRDIHGLHGQDRLVVQNETIVLQGLAQAAVPAEVLLHGLLFLAPVLIEVDLVASGALGDVTGDIRVGQHVARRRAVLIHLGDADTRADSILLVAVHEAVAVEQVAELVRCVVHMPGVDIAQDDGELVTAHAAQKVRLAQQDAQLLGDGDQQLVAGRVPGRIVDVFEPVQIDVQQRAVFAAALQAPHLLPELFLEIAAVDQFGQRVVGGLPAQPILEDPALRDVAERDHRAPPAAPDGQRADGAFHRDRFRGAAPEDRLPRGDLFVPAVGAGERTGLRFDRGAVFVGVVEQRARFAPLQALVLRIAEDLQRGRIEEGDPPGLVDAVHALPHGAEDTFQAPALRLDGPLETDCALHRGDPGEEQFVGLVLEHAFHGAGVQAVPDHLLEVGAGDDGTHDAPGARILAQFPAQHVAGRLRHVVVDDRDVELRVQGLFHPLAHAGRGIGAIAVPLQQTPEEAAHARGIVDEQDPDGVLIDRGRRRVVLLPDPGREQLAQGRHRLGVVVPQQQGGAGAVGYPFAQRGTGVMGEDQYRLAPSLRVVQYREEFIGMGIGARRPPDHDPAVVGILSRAHQALERLIVAAQLFDPIPVVAQSLAHGVAERGGALDEKNPLQFGGASQPTGTPAWRTGYRIGRGIGALERVRRQGTGRGPCAFRRLPSATHLRAGGARRGVRRRGVQIGVGAPVRGSRAGPRPVPVPRPGTG